MDDAFDEAPRRRRLDRPQWFVEIAEPALALGDLDVVSGLLAWLSRFDTDPSRSIAYPKFASSNDHCLAAALALVDAGMRALSGLVAVASAPQAAAPTVPEAAVRDEPLLGELHLALPLVRVVAGGRGRADLAGLPLPTVSGDRRDLWRLARAVVEADANDLADANDGAAARELLCGRKASAYRAAMVSKDFLAECDPEVRGAWAAVAARLAWLTRDLDLARVARTALAAEGDRLLVLGGLLPIGPAGFFLADLEHLLGDEEAAARANARAEQVCRRAGARAWLARCRLQRVRLGAGSSPAPHQDRPHQDRPRTDPAGSGVRPPQPRGQVAGSAKAAAPGPLERLSPRQRRILELAAAGLTNVQIARELYLGVATVERHCTMAYRTLGVRNRAQALGRLAALADGDPDAAPTRQDGAGGRGSAG